MCDSRITGVKDKKAKARREGFHSHTYASAHTHTHTLSVSHHFPSWRLTSHTTTADVRGVCARGSHVLHCDLTLVILCETLLELIDSHGHSARERRDGGGSNLAKSSHPASSSLVSPPIVLVKHWTVTSIQPILFRPQTHFLSLTLPASWA